MKRTWNRDEVLKLLEQQRQADADRIRWARPKSNHPATMDGAAIIVEMNALVLDESTEEPTKVSADEPFSPAPSRGRASAGAAPQVEPHHDGGQETGPHHLVLVLRGPWHRGEARGQARDEPFLGAPAQLRRERGASSVCDQSPLVASIIELQLKASNVVADLAHWRRVAEERFGGLIAADARETALKAQLAEARDAALEEAAEEVGWAAAVDIRALKRGGA